MVAKVAGWLAGCDESVIGEKLEILRVEMIEDEELGVNTWSPVSGLASFFEFRRELVEVVKLFNCLAVCYNFVGIAGHAADDR